MSRKGVHDLIRVWAHEPNGLEPATGWLESTELGFGALHALAEEESSSELPATHWTAKAFRAMAQGSSFRAGDHLIGHTPLHWCAWHGAPGVAAALLQAGAPACQNRCEQNPIDICHNMLKSSAQGSKPKRDSKLIDTLALLESQAERGSLEVSVPLSIDEGYDLRHSARI
jgi:hypothetical protein